MSHANLDGGRLDHPTEEVGGGHHTVSIPILHRSDSGEVDRTAGKAFSNAEKFVLYPTAETAAESGAGGGAEPVVGRTTVLLKDTTLPLPQSLGLATLYIFTSMLFFLCIRFSKANHEYNSALLMVVVECTKLTVSVVLKYREDGEFLLKTVFWGRNRRRVWRNGLPYAVPSLLYAVYNNMTFFNLGRFDPGTYQVFMQTRILFTGVLFTLFLHQALTYRKWGALFLLSIGVATKFFSLSTMQLNTSVVYMLFQALLSSLAGVYNEYAFKKDPTLSIHQQNFFMYLYAVFFNVGIGLLVAPEHYLEMEVTSSLFQPVFLLIVLLGAGTGLSAAFILKFINVIVKAFASAVEVLLTAVTAWVLLGESLSPQDVLAALIVMVAVYIYYTKGWGDSRAVTFGLR